MVDLLGIFSSTAVIFGLYAISSLSLNLEYGFTGIPNFGQVAFQAIGAFIAGSFTANFLDSYVLHLGTNILSPTAVQARQALGVSDPAIVVVTFALSLVIAGIVAACFGYLASFPALRLGEDYLALLLLVFGEVLRLVVRNYRPFVGGTEGLGGIPSPFAWMDNVSMQYLAIGGLVLVVVFVMYVYCEKLENSPFGRSLKAVRENELASQTLGKKISRIKGESMFIGSFIAGVGGALLIYYVGFAQADNFVPGLTFEWFLVVMLGGTANNKGVLLGAFVLAILDRGTRFVSGLTFFSVFPIDINYLRYIALGIIMLAVLAYNPNGIIPEKPVKTPAAKVVASSENP